jgi:hypothetical protein
MQQEHHLAHKVDQKQAILQNFNGDYLPFYERYIQADFKKENNNQLKVLCCFHDDKKASLSINRKTGQFNCFGCGAKGDFFTLYARLHGLSLNGDFPKICQSIINEFNIPVSTRQGSNNKKPTSKKKASGENKLNGTRSKIVQAYDYRDETFGDILFQKVRTEPKGFFIRGPGANGEWKNGLGKVKPPLYRQKQIIGADEVCITEGEKDADNLVKLGLTATTNFDGAGKWRPEYNESLAGKDINIFPDNDQQGRKHAQLVAGQVHPVAKSVKIIELPDLEAGEDISDYIAKFDNPETAAERISILIESTPQYEPPKVNTFKDGILDANDFIKLELQTKDKLLDPWLTMYQIALIFGQRGIGKTWFAMCLIDALTRGTSFGPWETLKSVSCLYLEADMPGQDTQARLRALNPDGKRKAPLLIYSDAHSNSLGLPRANLLDEEWRYNMKRILLDRGIKVWVADNLASLTPGIDENAKQDWDPINQWLLDLRFAGISTILMHHTNKAGGQRGTSAREDNIDISIMHKQPHNYDSEEGARFLVKFVKARVATSDLSKITDTQFHLRENEKGQLTWTYGCSKQETKKAVLSLLDGGTKQHEISDIVGISKGRVSQIKQWAYDQDYLSKNNKLTQTGFTFVNG